MYDGRSGEPFDRRVTVGVMHYLKLMLVCLNHSL
ncbi:hypothetical protein JF634_06320 [Simonsiella muelleri]|nr:hypothetical protein JF634_06320 [Simonsiella muelleri]